MKRLSLIGKKFSRLLVLEYAGINKRHRTVWKCRCDCGNEKTVLGTDLARNSTTSCGCYNKERVSAACKHNLIGRVFGRLTVLKEYGRSKTKYKKVLWLCKCSCGNESIVTAGNLRSGITQSCGCYNKERVSETHKHDLTTQKFGRLVVLKDAGRNKQGAVLWLCKCTCGSETVVIAADLRTGATTSCGCYQKEKASEANKCDLIGQKFGRLVVIKEAGRSNDGQVLWECLCDCGNKKNIQGVHLRRGAIISCGCYRIECLSGENNPNYKHGLAGTKEYQNAARAKRNATKRNQTPPDADMNEIQKIYKIAQDMNKRAGKCLFHVDHIVPLSKGGMHHEFNLQILLAKENLSKGAKI